MPIIEHHLVYIGLALILVPVPSRIKLDFSVRILRVEVDPVVIRRAVPAPGVESDLKEHLHLRRLEEVAHRQLKVPALGKVEWLVDLNGVVSLLKSDLREPE